MPERFPNIPLEFYAPEIEISYGGRSYRLVNCSVSTKNPFKMQFECYVPYETDYFEDEWHIDLERISFYTDEGWEVSLSKVYIENVDFHWSKGENPTKKISGWISRTTAIKGKLTGTDEVEVYLTIGGFEFLTKPDDQNPMFKAQFVDFKPGLLEGVRLYWDSGFYEGLYSGYLYKQTGYEEALKLKEGIFRDILSLFELAIGNYVTSSHLYIRSEKGEFIEVVPALKRNLGDTKIIEFAFSPNAEKYINSCFKNYDELKNSLDLRRIIHWYIGMVGESFLEREFLLGAVLMECLKHNFAKNVKKYPQDGKGFFWGNITGKKKSDRKGFKKLMEELYDHFGVANQYTRFIDYRNEVIHEGSISLPGEKLFEEVYEFQFFIGYLLLYILGYDGEVWDFKTNGYKKLSDINI